MSGTISAVHPSREGGSFVSLPLLSLSRERGWNVVTENLHSLYFTRSIYKSSPPLETGGLEILLKPVHTLDSSLEKFIALFKGRGRS